MRRFFGTREQLFSAVVTAVFSPERAVDALLDGPRAKPGSD
ncbi:hypothetical protein [Spongiactinospora sp. TRM90649]|nr:hypothetical protein [Spongiactinospora sp. TRM90649]MDF5753861.1 hypothetical protein [Spongiactinospora sp. TRM90649]